MLLEQLLEDIYDGEIGLAYRGMNIVSVQCDSRKVATGDMYVALKGSAYNGEDFIGEVIAKGAAVVVMGRGSGRWHAPVKHVCFLEVDDTKEFLHRVVRILYGNPSEKVRAIGITGTNGKTTVAYLIEAILNENQKQCGVVGTVNCRQNHQVVPATQTTPDFVGNQRFLAGLAEQNIPYCVMEVSSHALTQDRVYGIDFCAGIFTNLTSDHLDYHKTRENYFSAKARLFAALGKKSVAVINTDDLYGRQLLTMTEAKIVTYGIQRSADVMAKDINLGISGSHFTLTTPSGKVTIKTELIGTHNIYNILAASGVCLVEGVTLDTIRIAMERRLMVPGRLERVDQGQDFSIFIDYAHTQDALANVLTSIRRVSKAKIILVFGCGGDRDRTKRKPMGQVAGQLADVAIVTSDNPRGEDPQAIINEIIPGFQRDNFEVIVDRQEAIGRALAIAQKGDVVLIAGKGHETYQIFADRRVEFNERDIIKSCLTC